MAEIYLAAPTTGNVGQRVAIKVIHQQNASDPDFVRMLIDEAKLAVQLNHPNIVRTYDLGRDPDGYYIVMEFIDGADLFKVQQKAAAKRLSFPLEFGAFVARQVARGLDFAHKLRDENGRLLYIVHRDISPQNILLSFGGQVKITDFGIAKAAHRSEQTQAGIIKGKYYYMSPEQAAGRLIDGRTDIFAAGILLYEMLIGEMLYYDEDLDKLLAMVRKADIVPPSRRRRDVPPALEAIVMKALRKKPEDRFQSADEYGTALDEFLADFAPSYGPEDLGQFVLRAMDAPKNRSQRLRAVSAPSGNSIPEDASASLTAGLNPVELHEQLAQLASHDENSLIYQSADRLEALLRGAAPPQNPSSRASRPTEDDSGLETKRRPVAIDPELEATNPAEGTAGAAKNKKLPPHGIGFVEVDEARTNTNWDEQRVTRRHAPRRGGKAVEIGSESDDLHEQSTISHDNLPVGRAFARARGPAPTGSPSDSETTPKRPLEAAALARRSMEIPLIDPSAMRAAYAAARGSPRAQPRKTEPPVSAEDFDDKRPLEFELMPAPAVQESATELVISDDGYAHTTAAAAPVSSAEPKVELTQSDLFAIETAEAAASGAAKPEKARKAEDAISKEATHEGLKKTEVARPVDVAARSQIGAVAPVGRAPNSKLGYLLSGLFAATISAAVTWRVANHNRPPGPSEPQKTTSSFSLPTLLVFDVPEIEPPPAPLLSGAAPLPLAPIEKKPPEPKSVESGAAAAPSQAGELRLESTPPGASVYLRHKLVGVTPLVLPGLSLDEDPKVELRLDGYKKVRKHVKWKGKTSVAITVELQQESKDSGGAEKAEGAAEQ